jgi:hypothetical protein
LGVCGNCLGGGGEGLADGFGFFFDGFSSMTTGTSTTLSRGGRATGSAGGCG